VRGLKSLCGDYKEEEGGGNCGGGRMTAREGIGTLPFRERDHRGGTRGVGGGGRVRERKESGRGGGGGDRSETKWRGARGGGGEDWKRGKKGGQMVGVRQWRGEIGGNAKLIIAGPRGGGDEAGSGGGGSTNNSSGWHSHRVRKVKTTVGAEQELGDGGVGLVSYGDWG